MIASFFVFSFDRRILINLAHSFHFIQYFVKMKREGLVDLY